jgi:hypothetical protein
MRSQLVHRANDKVQNRFQLCRLASCSARRMSRNSLGMHLAINQALEAISGQTAPIVAQTPYAGDVKVPDPTDAPAFILGPAI